MLVTPHCQTSMQFEAPLRRPDHTVPREISTDPFTMCIVAGYRATAPTKDNIVALYGVHLRTIRKTLGPSGCLATGSSGGAQRGGVPMGCVKQRALRVGVGRGCRS